MKKLLVLALGMFVFTACSDDSSGGGAGGIVENLETSLVRLEVPVKNLGDVAIGSTHQFKFTVTNKSETEPMELYTVNVQSAELAETIDYGTCSIVREPNSPVMLYVTQDPGASCIYTFSLNIIVTDEGSPYVLYMEDKNKDKLTVVLPYTIK